jgi:hypothetical protein
LNREYQEDPLFATVWHLLKPFWWLIPLSIGLAYLKSPSGKGMIGELIVHMSAKLMLPSDEYRVLRNVTLPTEDGTTQIDHVIVSACGVFVIETKHYSGWIFGDANDKMWTQKFPRSSNTFQNPLRQNYKHTQTLAELLGVEPSTVFSVVVFVGGSTFKTLMPPNITYALGFIRNIKSKTMPIFSAEQANDIVSKIEALRLAPSMKTNREHVQHVRELVAAKAAAVPAMPAPHVLVADDGNHGPCPKCGQGVLVVRTTKKGRNGDVLKVARKFLSCSRYPSCRHASDYREPQVQ